MPKPGKPGSARSKSPELATTNLRLLEAGGKAISTPPAMPSGLEKVGTIYLDDFLADPQVDRSIELGPSVFSGQKTFTHSTVALHFADDGDKYAIFQETSADYAGASKRGARQGDSRQRVESLYGTASKIINLRHGICLRYEADKILFLFDENDQLRSWIIYDTEL